MGRRGCRIHLFFDMPPWDGEVAAFISCYNGRWPSKLDKNSLLGKQRPVHNRRTLVVRSARWRSQDNTLSIVMGREHEPKGNCILFFVYLPPATSAPPLLFADNAPQTVGGSLDRVTSIATQRKTTLSVLVDLAVDAITIDLAQQSDSVSLGNFRSGMTDISDILAFVTSRPRSLDLLVCLASACSRSFRRATLVDPFPSYFLAEDGGNDLNLFSACLNRIPPVSILTSITHDADANREALSDDVVVLLRWLIDLKGVDVKLDMLDQPEAALNAAPPTLNAAGVMVERRAQVRSEGLRHCFEMRLDHGDDPEFDQLEAQYGSVQAFHGSALENMHCILRCGLKTFSGDKERMRTGDVFGQGVYLSSELNIAHSFASRGLAWEKSSLGTYLTVVASCRIVLHPSVKRAKEAVHLGNQQGTGGASQGSAPMDAFPHTYYVVPEARHVRVCSLLVFADGPPAVNSVMLTNTTAALGVRRGLREEQAGERTEPREMREGERGEGEEGGRRQRRSWFECLRWGLCSCVVLVMLFLIINNHRSMHAMLARKHHERQRGAQIEDAEL